MNTMKPFESIVAAHGATVLRVCRAVLGTVDADDAWAETFLAALTAYPKLDAGANVEAWLVTIAHRKSLDVIRRRARHAIPVAELPERGGTHASGQGMNGHIWDDVAALPDRQRQALAYHYLGGLPFADVAQIVGGTTDAARRAAHDGIKKLRAIHLGTKYSEGQR